VIELAAAAAKSPSVWDQPGTLAFLVIFGMGVVLYFVFRSLARHLRKINQAARLEASEAEAAEAAGAGAAQADAGPAADAGPTDAVPNPAARGSLGQRSPR
jgi:hypothetical protein